MKHDLTPTVIAAARHVVKAWQKVSNITDPNRRAAMMALRLAVNAHAAQQGSAR